MYLWIFTIIITVIVVTYWIICIYGLIKYRNQYGSDAIGFMNLNSDFWKTIGYLLFPMLIFTAEMILCWCAIIF